MAGAHFRLEMPWREQKRGHEEEEVSALWLMLPGITLDPHPGTALCAVLCSPAEVILASESDRRQALSCPDPGGAQGVSGLAVS